MAGGDVAVKKYVVRLSAAEREELGALILKGKSPARQALALPYQHFKPFALLAAQPHNIFLYRNLLRSHDCLRRP